MMPADLDALPRRDGFRLRGMEMTRLETFIDAAFAFAISMLVIAGSQMPDDIDALLGRSGMCQRLSVASQCWEFIGAATGSGAGVMVSKMACQS